MCSPRNGPPPERPLGVRETKRRRNLAHRPEVGVLELDDVLAGASLRVLERRRDVVDRRARHVGGGEDLEPLADVRDAKASSSSGVSSSRLRSRAAKSAKRSSPASSGRPMALAEALPELRLRAGDDDPAVRGREVLERDDRRMSGVAPPRRRVALRRRPGADVHQLVQRGLEERDVAVAADAVAARAPQPGEHRDRRRRSRRRGRRATGRSWSAGRPGSPVRLIQPASPCIM